MPACARREIVRPGAEGIFHCWSRCVRRAFLMGVDRYTGKDYSHRRLWVLERLELLTANFAIDVAFLSILANHLHLVLRAMPRLVDRMGSWEVARRWLRVYPGRRVLDGQWIEPTEEQVKALAEDCEKIKQIRKRLANVSWFMAALCEYIARCSNVEDDCSGRFWQGRFSCREIADESALLICGLYVDLNQIRAGETVTPEQSLLSSVGLRIQASGSDSSAASTAATRAGGWLAELTLAADHLGDVPSSSGKRASDKGLLRMTLAEYLQLADWLGRQPHAGSAGTIPEQFAPVLERLGIAGEKLVETVDDFPRHFRRLAGRVQHFTERAAEVGRRWLQGVRDAARVFPS